MPDKSTVKRSVWGCLTCRRRKVKCLGRESPCAACVRLHLTCVPSFGGNLRQWKLPDGPPALAQPARQTPEASPSPFGVFSVRPDPPSHEHAQYVPSPQSFINEWSLRPPASDLDASTSLFVGPPVSTSLCGHEYAFQSVAHAQHPFVRSASPAPSTSADDDDRSLVVYYKRNLSSFFSVKSSVPVLAPSSPVTSVSALSAAYPSTSNVPVWNFYSYAIRVTEEKPDSPLSHSILAWTSAHLILRNRNTSDDHAQFRHYARARCAVDELRAELMARPGQPRPRPNRTRRSDCETPPLRMLLATTLFLAYSDILSGDCAGLVEALSGITQMLASDWPRFRGEIGLIEARILVWLSYLDLRARMWAPATPKPGGINLATTSLFHFLDARNKTMTRGGISALRALRRQRSNHASSDAEKEQTMAVDGRTFSAADRSYYLAECFGSALPPRELAEDLIQEPAKMLSDEIMGVYATISTLEAWIAGLGVDLADRADRADESEESVLLLDLRDTKIQAIRANIARIHAECKVVHADLFKASSGAEHIARTTFHRLVSTAQTLAATVLLNRVEGPRARTDDEAQAAAREIVQIARQLGQLGQLGGPHGGPHGAQNVSSAAESEDGVGQTIESVLPGPAPHSLVWPMPVFVAGIELTDPVYQDWVMTYLANVSSWGGTSTRRSRELLRRVMQQQDVLGTRVNVRDVVAEFGSVLI